MGSREDDMYWNTKYNERYESGTYEVEQCECGNALDEDGNCEECDG